MATIDGKLYRIGDFQYEAIDWKFGDAVSFTAEDNKWGLPIARELHRVSRGAQQPSKEEAGHV